MKRLTDHLNAVESLLSGLIDYAGLFPPASLDMRTAVSNYLGYRRGARAAALGRFVVDFARMDELREVAGDELDQVPLSVITTQETDPSKLSELINHQASHVTLELKADCASQIKHLMAHLPPQRETYFEIPFGIDTDTILDNLASSGARAKIRMGGATAEAFPDSSMVALMLSKLAQRHVLFKATAGLHHPIRSRHPYSEKRQSPAGMMHGFLNLAFAALLLHFDGPTREVLKILEEQDPDAWRVEPGVIRCRDFTWTSSQLIAMRKEFFISFGSCSFEEPIRELEVMGWL